MRQSKHQRKAVSRHTHADYPSYFIDGLSRRATVVTSSIPEGEGVYIKISSLSDEVPGQVTTFYGFVSDTEALAAIYDGSF